MIGRFVIFRNVRDLGYYAWKPGLQSKAQLIKHASASDILRRIDRHAQPPRVLPLRMLQTLYPYELFDSQRPMLRYRVMFPFKPPHIVPYTIALQRWPELRQNSDTNHGSSNLHFVFGTSTLTMLATQKIPSYIAYVAQKIPCTDTIAVERFNRHPFTLSDKGNQFKLFLQGKKIHGMRIDEQLTAHCRLQIRTVGEYEVLFATECDGIHRHGDAVEARLRPEPESFLTADLVFRLISTGASTLYAGVQSICGEWLERVEQRPAHDVVSLIPQEEARIFERNVIAGLRALRRFKFDTDAGDDAGGYVIRFEDGIMQLHRVDHTLFPSEPELEAVLPYKHYVDLG
jgi:hypothetical protein